MKKVTSLLALILALAMLFVACGGNKPAQTTAPDSGTSASTSASTTASSTTVTTQKPTDPTACVHTYTVKVVTQVTTSADGKIEKTCTKCGEKVEETLPAVKALKVLAIGNSFSVDAMEHLAVVAKAAGIEEIILGNLYIGGCSIDTHVGNANTGAKAYTYYKNTGDGWTESKNERLDSGIMDEDWDVITVQQVSQDSGRPTTFATLGRLLDFIDENKTNADAKVYWHMTWAYQQNFSDANKFGNYNKDQMTMYNAIVDAVKTEIIGNERISGFIPSGTAVQNLRTSYFGDTLTRDGFHMSYDIGRYTAALMWLKQLTGLDISAIEAIPSAYPNIIEHLVAIKEAVNAAYANPWAVTNSKNTEYVNELLIMTEADKAYLQSLGKNPDDYEVLDLAFKFSSFYNSAGASAKLDSTSSNAKLYIATAIFTSQTLPTGSVITIADGYQYRLEGWQKLSTKNSEARLENSTKDIILDESYYTKYNFIGFNISKVDGSEVVYDDRTSFRIYVPKQAEEDLALTEADKAYLTGLGLNPDNYEKLDLGYTLFAYYNTTSIIYSAPAGKVDNNLVNFLGTRVFSKDEIPVGSIIRIDDGYQYRPEGWQKLGTAVSGGRPANVTDDAVYVDAAWWKDYTHRGFNIATKGNSTVVTIETGTHFVIYALKAGATPVRPNGGTEPEPEVKPTTDAGWFESKKLDMSKYTLLTHEMKWASYYQSDAVVGMKSNESDAFHQKYMCTNGYLSKDQLPVGSVIIVDEGYQYRPEGWQDTSTKNTAGRPGNVTETCVVVDEAWWTGFNYRAFNLSKVDGSVIGKTDNTHIRIYVPKA